MLLRTSKIAVKLTFSVKMSEKRILIVSLHFQKNYNAERTYY